MQNRLQINRLLGKAGLATLDDPGGLVMQLGYLVEDHEHFRQLLNKCEPAERGNMYASLKPHLRFEAHPLDVYIAQSGEIAERKQLPVVGEGGKLLPFRTPAIVSKLADAITDKIMEAEAKPADPLQDAVGAAIGKEHLWLVCRKCTKEAVFDGMTKREAIAKARTAGWTYNELKGDCREICPDCP